MIPRLLITTFVTQQRKNDGDRVQESGDSRKTVAEDKDPYFQQSREDTVDPKASYDTVLEFSQTTEQSSQANGSFCGDTKRRTYKEELMLTHDANVRLGLQKHQSLVKPDFFYSTQVHDPQVMSYDHQEQGRFRHAGSMPTQSHSID